MKYIEYDVRNMAITRSGKDKTSPVSGSMNYYGVQFNFDEEFDGIAGAKSVEFYKGRNTVRSDLVEGKCQIPNDFLRDKTAFDMRVICGNSVATPWVSVGITESGQIMPDEPGEDAPSGMEYVRTMSGDTSLPYMRMGERGPEFSQDGENWQSGVSGVPDVPLDKKNKDKTYVRKNGDWVPLDDELADYAKQEDVEKIITINCDYMPNGPITDESVKEQLESVYAEYEAGKKPIIRINERYDSYFPTVTFDSSGNLRMFNTRIQSGNTSSTGSLTVETNVIERTSSGGYFHTYAQYQVAVVTESTS